MKGHSVLRVVILPPYLYVPCLAGFRLEGFSGGMGMEGMEVLGWGSAVNHG